MSLLVFSMLVGLAAGIIDVVPMIIKKLPKSACISAFLQYFFAAIIILHINLPFLPWWAVGGVVSLIMAIPIVILIAEADKKSVPIILGNAIILGTLISIAGHYLI